MDWSCIYSLVEEKYSADTGHPSLDPIVLVKMAVIQYMFGIRSMWQTVKEIVVNNAYRWFLGLDLLDPVLYFSTFGKNDHRRFADSDLFERIFTHVLEHCMMSAPAKKYTQNWHECTTWTTTRQRNTQRVRAARCTA